MDDIRIEDDPRKQSAKKLSRNKEYNKKSRGFFKFLFDLIVKSLLLFIILAADFTLFANAGSYSVFTNYGSLNSEAMMVYAAIGAISFVLVFLSMLILPLDNILLAAVAAATGIAVINQFAVFDKKSLLLILLGDLFSGDVNVMLYKYSHWIIGGLLFLFFYILFKLLRRSLLLYFTIAMGCLLGWILSESYFNSYRPFFRQIIANPTRIDGDVGNNLVFLSFTNLTLPSNFSSLQKDGRQSSNFKEFSNNYLGFLTENNFTVYPNVMVDAEGKDFTNLLNIFNPDDEEKSGDSMVVVTDKYFDFNNLQPETQYLDRSSLFTMLKKQGYELNVYENDNIDMCSLGNGNMITSCYKKSNYPFALPSDKGNLVKRSLLLFSQWIVSTRFVDYINPILSIVRYISDDVVPYSFYVNKLNSVNSFKVFDMILNDMERKNGNQAYFAVVDLPSDTLVYNRHCELKDISQWVGIDSVSMAPSSLNARQEAYYEQSNCLYGYLNKFMSQLEANGMTENTTVIITGISIPTQLISSISESNFYRKIQMSRQVGMAIKEAKADKYDFNYSVCTTKDILKSYFFTKKPCKDFSFIKTTDKNIEQMKKQVKQDKYSEAEINKARSAFKMWFNGWSKNNGYISVREGNLNEKMPTELQSAQDDFPEAQEAAEKNPSVADFSDEANNTAAMVTDQETVNNIENEKAAVSQNTQEQEIPVSPDNNALEAPESDNISNAQEQEIPVSPDNNALEAPESDNISNAQEVIPNTLFDNGLTTEEQPAVEDNSNTTSYKTVENDTLDSKVEVKVEQNVENETNPKLGYDLNKVIKEARQKALEEENKSAVENIKTKENNIPTVEQVKNTVQDKAKQIKSTAEKIQQKQDQAIRNILVAPKSPTGKQLSPEELKKQYHEMLRQAKAISGKTVSVEVVE